VKAETTTETAAPGPRTAAAADCERICCAVIVHYRCRDDVLACLDSLDRHAADLPVVVVENGSGAGVADALREVLRDREHIEVVDAVTNGGFGAGCNRGIERALTRFPDLDSVLLLNPDTVVTAGFLDALRATATRRRAGIVGGRLLDRDGGNTWFENGRIRPWTLTRCHVPAPAGATEFETGFVTGALMLVDGHLLRDGLRFDEAFFLYAEDMDLCREVQARGRALWINTEAVVRHRGGGSQGEGRAVLGGLRAHQLLHMTRGKVLFARKRLGWAQRLVYLATAVLLRPLAGLVVSGGSVAFLPPYFRGLWQGLTAPLAGPRRGRTDDGGLP